MRKKNLPFAFEKEFLITYNFDKFRPNFDYIQISIFEKEFLITYNFDKFRPNPKF